MAPGLTSRGDFSIALLPLSGLLVQPLGVCVWVVAFVPSRMTLASPESSRKWYHLVEVRLGCSRSQQGQIIFLKRCRVSKACAWKYQKFTGPFRWVCQLAVGSSDLTWNCLGNLGSCGYCKSFPLFPPASLRGLSQVQLLCALCSREG